MFGFVGPNGAGKTTAMRIVLGVLRADAARCAGARAASTRRRRRFGYMPEERGLYPKMRVRRQLPTLAALHGVPRPRRPRTAGSSGSGSRARRRSRRAALARQPAAGASSPPRSSTSPSCSCSTSRSPAGPVGVDVLSGVWPNTPPPACPSSSPRHQLELVERLCEAVAIIKDGRLVASGTVEELRGPGRTVVREVVERPSLAELFREAVK
jgi:ABC-2 type transport system ATP-binding protein